MARFGFLKNILGIVTAVFTVGLIFSPMAGAEAVTPAAVQGSQVSPVLVELNAEKGKTYNVTLNIMNVTTSDLTYTTSVYDFEAANETGSPKIIDNSNLSDTISVKSWVDVQSQFDLQSKKSKTITAQITIPNNAEAGGHYGVIRFSGAEASKTDDTGVGLSATTGVLLLIRVDGNITESASLASFYTASGDKKTSFFENSPITFVARIKNDGNIHVKPTGTIEVRDMFNNVVAQQSVNSEKGNVLPSSIRRFETTLTKPWMIGHYTANIALSYGTKGQAIVDTIDFWVIPYRIILAGIFILATIIYILSRLIKVYNRHIIAKAQNGPKSKKQKRSRNKK